MSTSWWLDELFPDLSQGDILEEMLFTAPVFPPTSVARGTGKGGKEIWTPDSQFKDAKGGKVSTLAEGRVASGLVLSHSCELDKVDKKNGRVTVVPILPISMMGDKQEEILNQEIRALLPLPDIPGVGTCVADLRLPVALSRSYIDTRRRICSMTDDARLRLHAQMAGFFFRVKWPKLVESA